MVSEDCIGWAGLKSNYGLDYSELQSKWCSAIGQCGSLCSLANTSHGTGLILWEGQDWFGDSPWPLLCPGSSCCRGRGAALMGVTPAGESTPTDTKPGFITVSTFDTHKSHGCPSLLCIFMHLWPQSIWLGWDIKLRYYTSSHKNQHLLFPSNRFSSSKLLVRRKRMGGDHQRHLMSQRDSVSSISFSCSGNVVRSISEAQLTVCVTFSLPPVHVTFCSPWEVAFWSSWPLHGSAAPLQLPTRARLEPSADLYAWWAEVQAGDRGKKPGQWLPPKQGVHMVFILTASRVGGGK